MNRLPHRLREARPEDPLARAYWDMTIEDLSLREAGGRMFARIGGEDWIEGMRRLHRLAVARPQLAFLVGPLDGSPEEQVRAQFWAWRLLAREAEPRQARSAMPHVDWDGVIRVGERLAALTDPTQRFAIGNGLPMWAARRVQAMDEPEALAKALAEPAPRVLRVREGPAAVEEVQAALRAAGLEVERGSYAAAALRLPSFTPLDALPDTVRHRVEVQDEASQLVAELVAPPPKGRVLDACAGAGGKTLALGDLMQRKGQIFAVDTSAGRLKSLETRTRKAGLSNVRVAKVEGEEWPEAVRAFAAKAHRILLDLPCSGLGAFPRRPEMRWRVSAQDVQSLPAVQRSLCFRAAELLAKGSRLIIATCTFGDAEGPDHVEALLQADEGLELVPVKEVLGAAASEAFTDSTGRFLQLRPDRHQTDGFFAAVVRRRR